MVEKFLAGRFEQAVEVIIAGFEDGGGERFLQPGRGRARNLSMLQLKSEAVALKESIDIFFEFGSARLLVIDVVFMAEEWMVVVGSREPRMLIEKFEQVEELRIARPFIILVGPIAGPNDLVGSQSVF